MLKIYFGEMENVIHNVDIYFKNQMEPSWLEDDFARRVIEDVDKSKVQSAYSIESPVLGLIPPTRLSGGTKALIIMKNVPGEVVNASNCGDNCAKWILSLGEQMDLTINLHHIMNFGTDGFEIEILNSHRIVHNMEEFFWEATEFI